jgi:hypothetical protein
MRFAIAIVLLAGCGNNRHGSSDPDAADVHADSSADGASSHDAAMTDAMTDATVTPHDAAIPDAFPSKLDLRINCHNDCTLIATPASIAVPAGTQFTVNWINTGDTDCDVAKIDQFNQVPIVLGLEPGNSYWDSVREWCGQFTGTFEFQISICTIPSYIPVNCGA